ncbi:hypothetical protein CBM2586_B10078 [Cupriavidus phytorum]|uniref:Uncharacterized protein n=1 Tax=Cupriavidus taiwanensis TaxID=164546 RepID=A0A975XE68_9BURK|nr:hypothetical protein CBM2586_B10078 [Cupriavidus taiwanensis]
MLPGALAAFFVHLVQARTGFHGLLGQAGETGNRFLVQRIQYPTASATTMASTRRTGTVRLRRPRLG